VLSLYADMAELPHFNPDDDVPPLNGSVEQLRAVLRAADAVVFSTPEYAGDLPGSFKNLLDWLVGDDSGSLYEKPVAWINCSPRGAPDAHTSLRRVLSYLGATIVDEACVHIPIDRDSIGSDGLIGSEQVRRSLADALIRLDAAI
jgi:NAD(P)H-dependent FMN reductase